MVKKNSFLNKASGLIAFAFIILSLNVSSAFAQRQVVDASTGYTYIDWKAGRHFEATRRELESRFGGPVHSPRAFHGMQCNGGENPNTCRLASYDIEAGDLVYMENGVPVALAQCGNAFVLCNNNAPAPVAQYDNTQAVSSGYGISAPTSDGGISGVISAGFNAYASSRQNYQSYQNNSGYQNQGYRSHSYRGGNYGSPQNSTPTSITFNPTINVQGATSSSVSRIVGSGNSTASSPVNVNVTPTQNGGTVTSTIPVTTPVVPIAPTTVTTTPYCPPTGVVTNPTVGINGPRTPTTTYGADGQPITTTGSQPYTGAVTNSRRTTAARTLAVSQPVAQANQQPSVQQTPSQVSNAPTVVNQARQARIAQRQAAQATQPNVAPRNNVAAQQPSVQQAPRQFTAPAANNRPMFNRQANVRPAANFARSFGNSMMRSAGGGGGHGGGGRRH